MRGPAAKREISKYWIFLPGITNAKSENFQGQNFKPKKKCFFVIFFGNGTCYSAIK